VAQSIARRYLAPHATRPYRAACRRDVVPLAPGTQSPVGIVGSVRLIAGPRSLVLGVLLPTHVPYKVEEDEEDFLREIAW